MTTALILTQIPALGLRASSTVNNGFMMDGTKLVKYTGTEISVSVPESVKTIGKEAFAENKTVCNIKLPKNLESIESGAFSGCSQLVSAEVPDGCKSIENGAFADCDNLKNVQLPATLVSMGTSVFAGCDKLSFVDIDKKNQYFVYEDGVIYNDKKTVIYQFLAGSPNTLYEMPNTIEEIKKFAFWGCSNLKEIKISSKLTEIGDYAFSNVSSLELVVLPYSVRAIRRKAFEDCVSLKNITIPISVTSIDETAFDGCFQLRINAEEGSKADEFYQTMEANRAANTEYEDSLSQNSVNPHWQEDKNEQAKPIQTTKIPYASDVEHYVEWDVDSPGVLGRTKIVSGQAVVLFASDDSHVSTSDASDSSKDLTVDEETMQNAIIDGSIAYKAFYGDKKLSQISIPHSVYTIGSFSFARSGLKEIVIPNGVETIESAAFYHCEALENVSIPDSVSEIGEDAFTNTKWLDAWFDNPQKSDFLVVGNGILLAYKGNSNYVTIPYGVKQIGAGAFRDHTEIMEVSIPDTVTAIGEDAFYHCSGLKNIVGMNSVRNIEDRAFYLCPITTVRIPSSVKEVGISAYGGTGMTDCVIFLGTELPELTYNESSTRLSANRASAFEGITSAVIDSSVKQYALKKTVLDSDLPGFEGIIYNISSGNDVKAATPVISSYAKDAAALPDTIYVYGNPYRVNHEADVMFDDAADPAPDTSLQGLMVVDHSVLQKQDVAVSQSGATQNLSGYHFYVSDSGQGTNDLKKAIQTNYGTVTDANSFLMDLSMYDPSDTIPINYLGKNTLTVTIPVPINLIGKELCIITLDRNKNPEVLLGSLSVKDSRQYVSFEVSHFSPYAVYAPEGELKEQIKEKWKNASGTYGLDDTPDTGDHINIRLMLLIGLFALGGFLLLLGFRDRPFFSRK